MHRSIHILGAGSIGQVFGLSIRSSHPSYPLTFLLRGNGQPEIRGFWKRGSTSTRMENVPVPVEYADNLIPSLGNDNNMDTLLVTTKSYQAKEAVVNVLKHVRPSRVVLLCNGALSVRDELLPLLDDIPLVLATTTHGAYLEHSAGGKVCLVHAGMGKTYIQEDHTMDLANILEDAGLNCTTLTLEDMNLHLWKKLAANCVINSLTALFRCTNGELLMKPSFYELQQDLVREVSHVAQATLTSAAVAASLDEASLRKFVQQVIEDTHSNKSSMLQDVLQQRRTEIDHLNGYVERKGRELGMECPTNEDVAARIRELRTTKI